MLSSPGLDRAIQYSETAVVESRGRGVLDFPLAACAKASARPRPKPRRSLGVAGARGMTVESGGTISALRAIFATLRDDCAMRSICSAASNASYNSPSITPEVSGYCAWGCFRSFCFEATRTSGKT
jgi:hypothetical protein